MQFLKGTLIPAVLICLAAYDITYSDNNANPALYGSWAKSYEANNIKYIGKITIERNKITSRLTCVLKNGKSIFVESDSPVDKITDNYILINFGTTQTEDKYGFKCTTGFNPGKQLYKIEGDSLIFIDSKDSDIRQTLKRVK